MSEKVVIVDKDSCFCAGIEALCGASVYGEGPAEADWGGRAQNFQQAQALLDGMKTDRATILLDVIQEPDISLRKLREFARLGHRCLVCTEDLELAWFAKAMMFLGAKGCISKKCQVKELIRALDLLAKGKEYCNQRIADEILRGMRKGPNNDINDFVALTPREWQVFMLTGQGLTARQISVRLGNNHKTVDTQRTLIKRKLKIFDCKHLMQAAVFANKVNMDALRHPGLPWAMQGSL